MKRFAFVGIVLAGCSGGGAPAPTTLVEQPLKVTCFRWVQDRAGRPVADYVVMLSRTWSLQYGAAAGEPFERVVRNPRKGSEIVDGELENLIRAMKAKGWDDLPATDITGLDAKQLAQMERDVRVDARLFQQYVWITVQTPTQKKTAFARDALMQGTGPQGAYKTCLELVGRGAYLHTAQTGAEPTRIGPK